MKVSLYSVSYAGLWYEGDALSVDELIFRAKENGFDGVEIDAKRPHGFPLDLDEKERKRTRDLAKSKGIEVMGVAGNNNFVSPFAEDRENELLALSEQIRLAHDLEAKVVRIFLAWPRITRIDGIGNYEVAWKYAISGIFPGPDVTTRQQWKWAKECLKEGVEIAEKYGVTLALQNHPPFIMHKEDGYYDMLDMVREVNSDYLKCSLDCPLLRCQDDDYITKAVKEVGSLQVISHFGGEFERDNSGKVIQVPIRGLDMKLINYPTFIKALKEVGYNGYFSFEFCHPVLTEDHELAGIERVNEQVKYGLEYIKNLVR